MRSRVGRWLTLTLGVLLLAFGVAETVAHLGDTVAARVFWSGTLLGGGALVLVGAVLWPRHPRVGFALVTIGAVIGMLPTAWTLVLPVLGITVIVLGVVDLSSSTGETAK
ncbi:hypothetical protein [Nocardioides taihuensis]|uniref:Integral membrane protein n=1 Tax=Nocardioides taihuensis TaxID=1835606 RepID=A0ABW0BF51_9ACTN